MVEGEITAKVTRRNGLYKLDEFGRAAVAKFLQEDYTFTVSDLGPKDRVTLTVTLTVAGDPAREGVAVINLELPAVMLEEVT